MSLCLMFAYSKQRKEAAHTPFLKDLQGFLPDSEAVSLELTQV